LVLVARCATIIAACKDIKMRPILSLAAVSALGFVLSGCAVAEVAGAGVSVATTVVTTTVDVAGDVVGGVADTVSGHSHGDKDSDDGKDKDDSKDRPRDDENGQ
jgi:hypothetical protein